MPEATSRPCESCLVPGCEQPRCTEDCCSYHAKRSNAATPNALLNDGVIDWIAIELAAQEARPVRLTWVEREIAAGEMLARGEGLKDIYKVLGVNLFKKDSRARRVYSIADALTTQRGSCAAA